MVPDSVQLRFYDVSGVAKYAHADGLEIRVPVSFGRKGLENILRELFGIPVLESGDDRLLFDFVVYGEPPVRQRVQRESSLSSRLTGSLLRAPLGKFCERRGIPLETTLHVEYFLCHAEPRQEETLAEIDGNNNWVWSLSCLKRQGSRSDDVEIVAYYGLGGKGGLLELFGPSVEVMRRLTLDESHLQEQVRALAWFTRPEVAFAWEDPEAKPDPKQRNMSRHLTVASMKPVDKDESKRTSPSRGEADERAGLASKDSRTIGFSERMTHATGGRLKQPAGLVSSDYPRLQQKGSFLTGSEYLAAGTLSGNIVIFSFEQEAAQCTPLAFSQTLLRDSSTSALVRQRASIESIDVETAGSWVTYGDSRGSVAAFRWDITASTDAAETIILAKGPANGFESRGAKATVTSIVGLQGHGSGSPIRCVRWLSSSQGSAALVCSASWDGSVRIWDVEQCACVHEMLLAGTRPNCFVSWKAANAENSHDNLLIVGCVDGSIRLLDPREAPVGKTKGATLRAAHGKTFISDVALLTRIPESGHYQGTEAIFSVGYDGAVRAWDLRCIPTESQFQNRAAAMLWEKPDAHAGKPVLRCSPLEKNGSLLTGGADGTVQRIAW